MSVKNALQDLKLMNHELSNMLQPHTFSLAKSIKKNIEKR